MLEIPVRGSDKQGEQKPRDRIAQKEVGNLIPDTHDSNARSAAAIRAVVTARE
jgi:hypothetical protein